jgi:hypothetical protein
VLPFGIVAVGEILDGTLRPRTIGVRLRRLHPLVGTVVVLVVAGPWHALAGMRNPGFLWDYFVNQHVLVFFDAKLPRDSIPDSLGLFWTMFFVRGFPWSLLLPAAALHAWRARGERGGTALLAAWLVVVLVFFSLAAGRLEHYSLPALPAVALLVGRLIDDVATGRARVARGWIVVPPLVCGAASLLVLLADPRRILAAGDPTLDDAVLVGLLPATSAIVGGGLVALGTLLATGRARAAVAAGVVSAVGLFVPAQLAHERVEPLFSWRPSPPYSPMRRRERACSSARRTSTSCVAASTTTPAATSRCCRHPGGSRRRSSRATPIGCSPRGRSSSARGVAGTQCWSRTTSPASRKRRRSRRVRTRCSTARGSG